jgi:hypothetical protein
MPRTLIAEDNLETTHYSSLIDCIKKVIFNLKNEVNIRI